MAPKPSVARRSRRSRRRRRGVRGQRPVERARAPYGRQHRRGHRARPKSPNPHVTSLRSGTGMASSPHRGAGRSASPRALRRRRPPRPGRRGIGRTGPASPDGERVPGRPDAAGSAALGHLPAIDVDPQGVAVVDRRDMLEHAGGERGRRASRCGPSEVCTRQTSRPPRRRSRYPPPCTRWSPRRPGGRGAPTPRARRHVPSSTRRPPRLGPTRSR